MAEEVPFGGIHPDPWMVDLSLLMSTQVTKGVHKQGADPLGIFKESPGQTLPSHYGVSGPILQIPMTISLGCITNPS